MSGRARSINHVRLDGEISPPPAKYVPGSVCQRRSGTKATILLLGSYHSQISIISQEGLGVYLHVHGAQLYTGPSLR
jgi:hypothetical protein